MTTSPALAHKLAKLKAAAPYELPKARLCANVVLATAQGHDAVKVAVRELKHGLGASWSSITAFQYMSGRRGEFAAECGAPDERVRLLLAHQIAQQVCNETGLGGVAPLVSLDLAKLRALDPTLCSD